MEDPNQHFPPGALPETEAVAVEAARDGMEDAENLLDDMLEAARHETELALAPQIDQMGEENYEATNQTDGSLALRTDADAGMGIEAPDGNQAYVTAESVTAAVVTKEAGMEETVAYESVTQEVVTEGEVAEAPVAQGEGFDLNMDAGGSGGGSAAVMITEATAVEAEPAAEPGTGPGTEAGSGLGVAEPESAQVGMEEQAREAVPEYQEMGGDGGTHIVQQEIAGVAAYGEGGLAEGEQPRADVDMAEAAEVTQQESAYIEEPVHHEAAYIDSSVQYERVQRAEQAGAQSMLRWRLPQMSLLQRVRSRLYPSRRQVSRGRKGL
ncbi:hypothetical protein CLOP_g4415 [Closterium sp. NIES-67]|nr:hypothetical protein CLOP_g4415 [Closterium sp. NIES-67]